MKRTDGQKRLSARLTHRKAFTLVELLVVIAIIGILFVVLISKVDFATEKAKATGVQTDFRSYQLAIETVARENAGLSTLVDDDASGEEKYAALEAALNKNLDPKLRVEIDADGKISTDAKDPWKEEYTGQYLAPDADGTVKDRGAIVMYCKGSNLKLGTTSETVNGVVNVTIESGKEAEGADDYAISTIYTYVNGYGEIKTTTEGFSNDIGNIGDTINTPSGDGELDEDVIIEIWMVDSGEAINFTDLAAENNATINTHLVDTLPETMIPLDMENGIMDAYILESTGVIYGNLNGTVMTLGQLMADGAAEGTAFDKGWSEDIYLETEDGFYCVRTSKNSELEELERVEFWAVNNGSIVNYTYLLTEQGATINTYLVDELPETLLSSNLTTLIINAYVIESTGIGYINVGGTVMTLGQFMADGAPEGIAYDKGWSEDIFLEAEDGVYCVCLEVAEIAEIWVILDGVGVINYSDLATQNGVIVNTHLVDTLPETMTPSNLGNWMDVYIIKNTGVGYVNNNGTVLTFGQLIFGQETYEFDHGWTTNINSETEDGVYLVRTVKILGQKPGQIVAGFYDANGYLLVNWDTLVVAHGIDVEKNYGQYDYNENYYKTDTTSPYYIITNKLPATAKVVIPDTVSKIGDSAFSDCANLMSVTIPNSVMSIGSFAFVGCRGLTSITIPDSVTSIGYNAFCGCSGLTSIVIPNNITIIEDGAFWNCFNLTGELIVPDSVISIGSLSFSGCSKLTSITLGSGVTNIGVGAFGDCSGLASITVDDANTVYYDDGNCLIEAATCTLVLGCKNSVIPADGSVTSIGSSAFCGCSGLTSITIPDSVTSIGASVFHGCFGLTGNLVIPSGVTQIGIGVFAYCPNLGSLTVEATDPPAFVGLEESMFAGSGYKNIYVPAESVDAYKEARGWRSFADYIQAIPTP